MPGVMRAGRLQRAAWWCVASSRACPAPPYAWWSAEGSPSQPTFPGPCCPGNWAVPAQASVRRRQLLVAHHPGPAPDPGVPWSHSTGLRLTVHSHERWAQGARWRVGAPGTRPALVGLSVTPQLFIEPLTQCPGPGLPWGPGLGVQFPSTQCKTGSPEGDGCRRCDLLGLGMAGVAWLPAQPAAAVPPGGTAFAPCPGHTSRAH